jgi:uncharacterized protein (TIGR00369 family)
VWRSFNEQRRNLPPADTGVSLTRERWLLILFQELGYGRLAYQGRIELADGAVYPISHQWEGTPIHLTSIEPGQAVFEYEATEGHANPMGTLHGGILCTIADSAMGMAYASRLEAGESFTTLEMKINFLKPVWQAKLRAIGRVIKNGRSIGLVECDILDEQDALVAHATSTCMTLRGEQAQGR